MNIQFYISGQLQNISSVDEWLNLAIKNKIDFFEPKNKIINALIECDMPCYPQAIQTYQDCIFLLIYLNNPRNRHLLIISKTKENIQTLEFEESIIPNKSYYIQICATNRRNNLLLRRYFPHISPSPALSTIKDDQSSISFGLGDRLGIASFGHLLLFSSYHITPILAQQSKRELNLTGRNYADVIEEASWDVFAYNYRDAWGADGDHLKTSHDITKALEMGCTMITADLSDKIKNDYLLCTNQELEKPYQSLDTNLRDYIDSHYTEAHIKIDDESSIYFDPTETKRIVLTYHNAIILAKELYQSVTNFSNTYNKHIEFEISIDETSVPTTAQAHFFVAQELTKNNIKFESMAPRFCGEFQKGIDYIGDTKKFEEEIIIHKKIANLFSYKISIHSGSDKFSIFPIVSAHLHHKFHIKTSGTNWLIALQTISRTDPLLFRTIYQKAYEVFDTATQYYHITPDFDSKESINILRDEELDKIFENNCDRQVLHIAYGEIFKNASLKNAINNALQNHIEKYWALLNEHIKRHIELLV